MTVAVEWLDGALIRGQLQPLHDTRLHGFEVLADVDSTNSRLLAVEAPPFGYANVCLAEAQHAGRGRRGRSWTAPPGAAIAMSTGWAFRSAGREMPALGLAVGVAVVRALGRAGAHGVTLKWPNDIWFEDRKIGGILLELRSEREGPAYVVIGIGINVTLDAAQ